MNKEFLIVIDGVVYLRITCTYKQACKELERFRTLYSNRDRVELAQVIINAEEL